MEFETSCSPEIEELSSLLRKARQHVVLRAFIFVSSLSVVFALGMILLNYYSKIPFWLPVLLMVVGVIVCIVVYAQFGMTIVYRRARELGYRVVMNEWGRCFALKVHGVHHETTSNKSRAKLLVSEMLGLYDRRNAGLIPLEEPSYEESHDRFDDDNNGSDEDGE